MDEVIVRFPSLEWAESAIADLAGEGCDGTLLPERDGAGLWQVLVAGPACKIAEIRYATQLPAERVDWEAFVNAAIPR